MEPRQFFRWRSPFGGAGGAIWTSFYVLLCIVGQNFCCEEESLAASMKQFCVCHSKHTLHCQGINDTQLFRTTQQSDFQGITQLKISESQLPCLHLDDLESFTTLTSLTVTNSGLRTFICSEAKNRPLSKSIAGQLHHLNLARNKLKELKKLDFVNMVKLQELILKNNEIQHIPARFFAHMQQLKVLDLSNNKLDEFLKPSVFKTLPAHLSSLDISNNTWACSSKLAWMHKWKDTLKNEAILKNRDDIQCIHEKHHSSRLFLVMKYYDEFVVPQCPIQAGCTCQIKQIQENVITTDKRIYTVHVNCTGKGLQHFPAMPERTQTVDLSDNQLNDSAFTSLNVKEHHYKDVENLDLSGNRLENLSDKLLKMNLRIRFSATNNRLTSISYDVSQRLMKKTNVLELSNNPWKCTCSSEINDRNLLEKVTDKKNLTCGPSSDVDLAEKRIVSIDPEVLCPPMSNGEAKELWLQILCALFAFGILVLILNLIYDCRNYNNHGQLPRIAQYSFWRCPKVFSC